MVEKIKINETWITKKDINITPMLISNLVITEYEIGNIRI